MENRTQYEFRPEKVREAREKIKQGLDKDPGAIGGVLELLPEILGIPCWHCGGEKTCNCLMCSSSLKRRPCQICFGIGNLSTVGTPLISEEEFWFSLPEQK